MYITSNAKINLFLEIAGTRKDGFHDIITVFQEISLSDTIRVLSVKGPTISVSSNIKEIEGKANIGYKIAKYLQNKYGIVSGCDIRITKKIPIGAGLGGGSGNGAAVLLALNKLWRLKLQDCELIRIAAEFGSDVPFFLVGGTALGLSRGEVLSSLKFAGKYHVFIVYPDLFISTKEVYAGADFCLTKIAKTNIIKKLKRCVNGHMIPGMLYNRLEDVVFQKYAIVPELKSFLLANGADCSLMSGSGSTVFGLFDRQDKLKAFEKKYRAKYRYPCWICETVPAAKRTGF